VLSALAADFVVQWAGVHLLSFRSNGQTSRFAASSHWTSGLLQPENTSPNILVCCALIALRDTFQGIKGWYWPQGLLSMPTDNSHKSWETPSDKTSVSSASKSDFLTSSIVIPGQCNFSCSREERMKASPWRLKTETFG